VCAFNRAKCHLAAKIQQVNDDLIDLFSHLGEPVVGQIAPTVVRLPYEESMPLV
jgi:hypothetical protein